MPNPQKEIRFSIDTIEDMMFNDHVYAFFQFLETLIKSNFELSFYRIDRDECLTTIRDLQHLENFKKSFKFIK